MNQEKLNQLFVNASINGDLNAVQKFHQQGADIHADNDEALRWSACHGNLSLLQYLIGHGGDIHTNDDSLLQLSVYYNHLPIVRYLAEQGVDISCGIKVAQEANQPEILSWLEAYQLSQQEKQILLKKSETVTISSIKNRL